MNIHQRKQEICEIGRRLYERGFAAANDGNISYRISENEVLCSPTMICKGFMKPDDLCVVDLEGKQLAGRRKRTSEILLHLAIMKRRPDVKSVVHCHPPHATAFAVAREPIPQCVLPEVEVFLGDVPMARYETPGGSAFAETVLPFVDKTNVIILANHGTVSYGDSVEQAYWWTEILDSYCRILMLARGLGNVAYFNQREARELLDLKSRLGFSDARLEPGMENCDICANDVFRESWCSAGVAPRAFPTPTPQAREERDDCSPARSAAAGAASNAASSAPSSAATVGTSPAALPIDQERLVELITDRVLAALAGK